VWRCSQFGLYVHGVWSCRSTSHDRPPLAAAYARVANPGHWTGVFVFAFQWYTVARRAALVGLGKSGDPRLFLPAAAPLRCCARLFSFSAACRAMANWWGRTTLCVLWFYRFGGEPSALTMTENTISVMMAFLHVLSQSTVHPPDAPIEVARSILKTSLQHDGWVRSVGLAHRNSPCGFDQQGRVTSDRIQPYVDTVLTD
jgi:hypothetical protein